MAGNPLYTIYTDTKAVDNIIDETDPNCVYVGWAIYGTATSVEKWRIKRIKLVGAITYIGWADSNDNFDNEWDNRATLAYSQGG